MNPEIEELLKTMTIEAAREEDLPSIVRLAHASRLDVGNINKDDVEAGFLIYSLDEERYKTRLNKYFYTSKALSVDGFLMCYDRIFLQQLISSGQIDHEDGIINFLQKIGDNKNFIYGDQICLAPNMRQLSIGRKMMIKLFTNMCDNNIDDLYVTILHQPVLNEASKAFCESLGAKQAGEATNSDNLTWGIYKFEAQNSLASTKKNA